MGCFLLYFLRLGTVGFGGPIAVLTGLLLLRWKVPEPLLVLAAGLAGLLFYRG